MSGQEITSILVKCFGISVKLSEGEERLFRLWAAVQDTHKRVHMTLIKTNPSQITIGGPHYKTRGPSRISP